tara:strand:- start:356 stop:586 length:231 start_codon:yes stop_codon:yes gene_type:complete
MGQQEIEIKGILVEFFRNGTNEDYLDALYSAVDQLKQIKNHGVIGDVSKSVICGNCDEECQPYSLGQNCNKCHVEL